MKHILLSALLAAALGLGACSTDGGVNGPVSPSGSSSLTSTAQQLDLSKAQEGELEEMFYLGEDASSILTPAASTAVSNFINAGGRSVNDDRGGHPRRFFDMAAMMYFRAALKANTDISDDQKNAIAAAIEASNKTRAGIAADATLDPAAKAAALKAEHDALMAIIRGILTTDQITKTEELIAQIEAERKAKHAEMLELRIKAQIARWNVALTLSDAQKTGIAGILRALDAEIQALREQYKNDPEGFRAAVQALQAVKQAEIRALLDENQALIWDKIVAAGLGGGKHGGRHGGGHGGRGGRHGG